MASALPSRRSIRLKDFDYSSAGMYVVTICTFGRRPLFGRVVGKTVELTTIGRIVDQEWRRTPHLRPNVELDIYVIMPNHIHGIIAITESDGTGASREPVADHRFGSPGVASQTLTAVVRGFKGSTTRRIGGLKGDCAQLVWQRGYHEHIIRNEADLQRIRQYIATNPLRWSLDRYFRGE